VSDPIKIDAVVSYREPSRPANKRDTTLPGNSLFTPNRFALTLLPFRDEPVTLQVVRPNNQRCPKLGEIFSITIIEKQDDA
jgi:hypothetical protein